jgi:AAA domain-containing protein/primase/DNA polymerase family protein
MMIPAALQQINQWAVSVLEGEQKVPRQLSGAHSSISDPTTWDTYENVKGAPIGIGPALAITKDLGLVAIDLDVAVDEAGAVHPEAQKIVDALQSYTEISHSGRGLHIIARGSKPPVQRPWTKLAVHGWPFAIEMFDHHFLTITGNQLPGTPDLVQERQDAVTDVYFDLLKTSIEREPVAEVAPRKAQRKNAGPLVASPDMVDTLVLKKIAESKQGMKFIKLLAGLHEYPSASEADFALAGVLAFWTQDPEQIERIMRTSELARPKWDEHPTYLADTITRAVETRSGSYTGVMPVDADLGLMRLSDVAMRAVPWMWGGYIPAGAVTLLVGDAGLGKTLVAFDLAARVTTGKAWPDGLPNLLGLADALILSAEDSASYTIRPRIEAAGGDVSRVHILKADTAMHGISLQNDVLRLEAAINRHGIKFIVIDPLSAYMPKIDTYRDNEVRSALTPFVAMAERCGVTVLAIIHMSKNIERNAMQRILGSVAFNALARASYMVAMDPEGDHRRVFVHVKFNLGPTPVGLAFTPASATVQNDQGQEIQTAVTRWADGVRIKASADEIVRQNAHGPAATKELDDALRALLTNGPVLAADATEKLGKSEATLRRARERVGVVAVRDPADTQSGPYFWLPPAWPKTQREEWERARMAERKPPAKAPRRKVTNTTTRDVHRKVQEEVL